jgi:hypothetical protein
MEQSFIPIPILILLLLLLLPFLPFLLPVYLISRTLQVNGCLHLFFPLSFEELLEMSRIGGLDSDKIVTIRLGAGRVDHKVNNDVKSTKR